MVCSLHFKRAFACAINQDGNSNSELLFSCVRMHRAKCSILILKFDSKADLTNARRNANLIIPAEMRLIDSKLIWMHPTAKVRLRWIWNSNYDFQLLSLHLRVIYVVFPMPPDRRKFKEFFMMRLSTETARQTSSNLIEIKWRNKIRRKMKKQKRLHNSEIKFSSAGVSFCSYAPRVEFIRV